MNKSTSPQDQVDPISLVGTALESTLKLTPAKDLKDLFEIVDAKKTEDKANARFLLAEKWDAPITVVCGSTLELSFHGLVVDPNTATLGLVQICQSDLEAEIQQSIRDAVSLRHTLLQNRHPQKRAYSVELVIVTPPSDNNDTIKKISDVLQRYMMQTSYMHAIGVSVFSDRTAEGYQNIDTVRRAFPWIMHSVLNWYQSKQFEQNYKTSDGQKKNTSQGELTSITLENLRLAGTRSWKLLPKQHLHLIHGHNGTGKSTFTEAFELMLTGRLERLAYEETSRDYVQVLKSTYVAGSADASITADYKRTNKSKTAKWTIDHTGAKPAAKNQSLRPDESLDAGSFRLEQSVADDLVRTGPGRTAERFLSAFFPQAKQTVDQTRQARQRFDAVWRRLPKQVKRKRAKQKERPEQLHKELAWIERTNRVPELAKLSTVPDLVELMTTAESLGLATCPDMNDVYAWDSAWKSLWEDAERLRDEATELRPVVQRLNNWCAETSQSVGSKAALSKAMSDWVDCCARCDLMQKEMHILGVVTSDRLEDENVNFFLAQRPRFNDGDVQLQLERLEDQQQQREELHRLAMTMSLEEDTSSEVTGAKPVLSSSQLKLLTEHLIEANDNSKSVQFSLEEALNRDSVTTIRYGRSHKLMIGTPGGLQALADRLQQRGELGQRITQRDAEISLEDILGHVSALRNAANDRAVADNKLALSEFAAQMKKGGDLANAVNELTALFTPAQWAYKDVSVDVNQEDGTTQISDRDDLPAELRLNTAELNTLAIVLFLLCAPSVRNPLRMLVLDDPLQNMDELTVTTVARGLSRLFFIWDQVDLLREWKVTMLLHGEENLERMRRECRCAAYFLPWLTPHTVETGEGSEIRPDQLRFASAELSPLAELFVLAKTSKAKKQRATS